MRNVKEVQFNPKLINGTSFEAGNPKRPFRPSILNSVPELFDKYKIILVIRINCYCHKCYYRAQVNIRGYGVGHTEVRSSKRENGENLI